jgi:uncharacterized protein (TIGR02246 family)
MKLHLLAAASLAIGLAVPALAKERIGPCTGPEDACRQIAELEKDEEVAFNKNDAAAVAALYTQDAVYVTEGPVVSGRNAIEKTYTDAFKTDSNLELNIGESRIMGDTAWAWGGWSVISSGKPLHGNWVTLFVREGGAWKMRVDTYNVIEAK